jgi:hypothetical protein
MSIQNERTQSSVSNIYRWDGPELIVAGFKFYLEHFHLCCTQYFFFAMLPMSADRQFKTETSALLSDFLRQCEFANSILQLFKF